MTVVSYAAREHSLGVARAISKWFLASSEGVKKSLGRVILRIQE
jgi:hypothetical protein